MPSLKKIWKAARRQLCKSLTLFNFNTMPLGFCPALLTTIDAVAESNSPTRKLQVAGFLASLFCCQNSAVSPINEQFQGAHKRTLTVKYRQRPTSDNVQDEDNCEVNRIPAYSEWTVPALGFKSTSFFLDDNTIQSYCVEASQLMQGAMPTAVMMEIYTLVLEHANLLLREINKDLVTQMGTQFGDNVTTGSSTGKVLNISRDGDKYILDNGIVEMIRDFQENEICGEPCVIGGGLFASFTQAQALSCCNSAGMDLSRAGLPRFFYDKDTQNIWGTDTVGVLAPGSVKFIGRNRYTGNFGGQKGTSFFGTFPMPVAEFGCNLDDCLRDLIFDIQLKYIDCPTEIEVNGVPTTVDRGWQVIVSKEYALWVQPTNAYAAGDELEGTNGTLKYFITNNTADTAPYAYA